MSLLEVKNLSKQFPLKRKKILKAVDNVSFSISKNETLGLVGESGSGKSTIGQMILGLHEPTSGDMLFEGEPLPARRSSKHMRTQASQMQMIFQNPYASLNGRMSVREILAEPLRLAGKNNNDGLIEEWIERVGLLKSHLNRYPHEFSGGQRQRIAIARALINEPKFIVCDEPISALDLSVQAQIVNMLADLKETMGVSLLFIAHDLSMVRYISDRIAVMYQGKLVEIGESDRVFREPRHPYTQLLISSNLVPNPSVEKAKMEGEAPFSGLNNRIEHATDTHYHGCVFYERCKKADESCKSSTPSLETIGSDNNSVDHLIACFKQDS